MFHNTLQDLANYFTKKSTKTPQTILAESGLSVSHFTELQSLVRNLLSHARATQNTIDKIRDQADIVDVIGDDVELKRRGVNYFGFWVLIFVSFVLNPFLMKYFLF